MLRTQKSICLNYLFDANDFSQNKRDYRKEINRQSKESHYRRPLFFFNQLRFDTRHQRLEQSRYAVKVDKH